MIDYMAWSQSETEQLKECYYTSTSKELEDKFGRTIKAIRTKAERLGMRLRKKKNTPVQPYRRPIAAYNNVNTREMLLNKYAS